MVVKDLVDSLHAMYSSVKPFCLQPSEGDRLLQVNQMVKVLQYAG